MNTKLAKAMGLAVCWAATAALAALPVDDGFETYTAGKTFVTPTNDGWQADSTAVVVTNDPAHRRGTQSAALLDVVQLTNIVNAGSGLKVWTDAWVEPSLGGPPLDGVTNGAMHAQYFDTNGYLTVATTSGWYACSNDMWGGSVAAVTNSRFVHVSLFQDYGKSNWALFVDGRLALQEQPFTPPPGGYHRFVVRNADSNAWLDDVWIKTNYNSAVLTNSYNLYPMADAEEVALFGYAAQTLYVGPGPGNPHFASIQAAVDAWRLHDSIYVYGSNYTENVVVTQAVAFVGQAFTNNGGLTVASGADISFAQSTTWSNVVVTGTVSVATGGGMGVQSNLAVASGGQLSFTNGTLVVPQQGIALTGTFSIDSTWGTAATMPLTFQDNFELYAANTPLQNLGFRGWGATSNGVVVQAGVGNGPSQGVLIPSDSVLSNRVDRGAATRIWTDLRVRLEPGIAPINARTNEVTFACYVDTNLHLVVNTPAGWVVCSNYWGGSTVPDIDTQNFSRVTVHEDLVLHKFAVFLDGRLLCESLTFSGGALGSYRSLTLENSAETTACADDVLITTNMPFASGYPAAGWDQDGDNMRDADEIDRYGSISDSPRGSVFKIR